jgi:hypothetical protein
MANRWYFARDGKTSGPFSGAQLQELAAAGEIRPQDIVWRDGTDKRVPAARVQKLFAAPPAQGAAAGPPVQPCRPAPHPAPPAGAAATRPITLAERLASREDLELAPGTKLWEAGAPAEPAGEERAGQEQSPAPPQSAKNR